MSNQDRIYTSRSPRRFSAAGPPLKSKSSLFSPPQKPTLEKRSEETHCLGTFGAPNFCGTPSYHLMRMCLNSALLSKKISRIEISN